MNDKEISEYVTKIKKYHIHTDFDYTIKFCQMLKNHSGRIYVSSLTIH